MMIATTTLYFHYEHNENNITINMQLVIFYSVGFYNLLISSKEKETT